MLCKMQGTNGVVPNVARRPGGSRAESVSGVDDPPEGDACRAHPSMVSAHPDGNRNLITKAPLELAGVVYRFGLGQERLQDALAPDTPGIRKATLSPRREVAPPKLESPLKGSVQKTAELQSLGNIAAASYYYYYCCCCYYYYYY